MLQAFIVTLTGVALGQLLPGPNLLAVACAALGQGRRTATFVAAGVATAIFAWVTLAAFGLGALLNIFPKLLTALKLLGGGYLCYLAIRSLRGAWRGGDTAFEASEVQWTPFEAWRRGLLVNLTNPKSALMWGAVATFLFGSGLSAPQVLAFAPLGCASAFIIYATYAVLFSSGVAKRTYLRFSRSIQALFGLAFGALGVKLAADGLGEAVR